ncbi:ATP-grasp domain-containing protein [Flavobacterium caeni]|uniref:Carbamoyl-phosphate synthase large subunit n=1 Tax=Flavobacterium caeni TaxID=490189 RepID=A0A1G5FJ24_9FLAO|nr:ATP-grasp domain-containing protein [Flavobacterium caeni]SCY39279.1 carbamoyl-phosphate synthase large subunit [Flavobacterium caeni]
MNILITSAGRRVSLVRFFKQELRQVFPDGKVIASDAHPELSSACMVADDFFRVPRVSEPGYIQDLLRLAREYDIKLIVPTIDTELLILSESIDLFRMNGIEVVISDFEIVKIFRDKRKTHDFFAGYGIQTAREFDKQDYTLPLYLKPIDGSRSVDNFIIKEASQLTDYHFSNDKLMFLEYLDHKQHVEYTIDLYYDRNSELKCFIPRKRIEVRDGEVNKAVTKKTKFIHEIWKKMSYIAGFRGCITFQVFVNKESDHIYGIEINPRFGGGYPLSYLAGGNFPKWIIQEYLLGERHIPVFEGWEENLMMLRYDDEVLVHNYSH